MSNDKNLSISHVWSDLLVGEFVKCGVTHFILSPGSRSTPLAAAVARQSTINSTVHFDERGAAFFAQAIGWVSSNPACLISTSGTACANYFPAVIESAMQYVPLIVLTADRPPEARQTGANQTIDQVKIYGNYPRWYVDVPVPTEEIHPHYVLSLADQAFTKAVNAPAGPVHLNCMFRKPLHASGGKKISLNYQHQLADFKKKPAPSSVYLSPNNVPDKKIMDEVSGILNSCTNVIAVIGNVNTGEAVAIERMLKKLNISALVDAGAPLRYGKSTDKIITHTELLLQGQKHKTYLKPDAIIQFGSLLVSKALAGFIQKAASKHYMIVENHRDKSDPHQRMTHKIETDIAHFCAQLSKCGSFKSKHDKNLLQKDRDIDKVLGDRLAGEKVLSEAVAANVISRHTPAGYMFFLGNSMPIRSMGRFAHFAPKTPVVGTNRGASGIDGIIASAAGSAAGAQKPVVLFIGDVSFLHDLNSLALINKLEQQVVIVLANNDGGGIFHHLPVAADKDMFEEFIVAPHGYAMDQFVAGFGIKYFAADNPGDFEETFKKAVKSKASTIIELFIDREQSFQSHNTLTQKITRDCDL